jgi:hypothetical protein
VVTGRVRYRPDRLDESALSRGRLHAGGQAGGEAARLGDRLHHRPAEPLLTACRNPAGTKGHARCIPAAGGGLSTPASSQPNRPSLVLLTRSWFPAPGRPANEFSDANAVSKQCLT